MGLASRPVMVVFLPRCSLCVVTIATWDVWCSSPLLGLAVLITREPSEPRSSFLTPAMCPNVDSGVVGGHGPMFVSTVCPGALRVAS